MRAKIATAYLITGSDGQVIVNVKSGLLGIAANVGIYATPLPPLATVQTALDGFVTAVADAVNGGVVETAMKNAKRVELAALVRSLSNYVVDTANGSLANLMASGLPIQKPGSSPVGPLPPPKAPVATQGPISGSLSAASSPVYGASIYNWRLALASAPSVYLQTAQTPGARVTFKGLTPGETYNVELNAVGAAGTSDWSDDGSTMIL